MDVNQRQFLDCISAAIHAEKISTLSDSNICWMEIVERAENHKVKSLIFYSLGNIKPENIELYNNLKRDTILASIAQINHIHQVEKVISKFNERNIPVIALKGIVLRELYLRPEFRTMSDSDLLVHKDDLEKSKKAFLELGYVEDCITKNHISFKQKSYANIDLHWTLEDKRFNGNIDSFDKDVWKNTISMNIGNAKVLALSWEDMLVHQLIHIAGHMVYGGFGIRQLCDIELTIEKKGNEIDWTSFWNRVKSLEIEKFAYVVFCTCKNIFGLKMPERASEMGDVPCKFIDEFMSYVYLGGVYGNMGSEYKYGSRLGYSSSRLNSIYLIGLERKIIKTIFPKIKKLNDNFRYCRKHPILLPVAWLQYMFKYLLGTKKVILSIPISRRRFKLFRFLEL